MSKDSDIAPVRPQRIVSLSPNVSMILFALGVDDIVVGRTAYCLDSIERYLRAWDIPASEHEDRLICWRELPDLGRWPDVDKELALELQPDLIIASQTLPAEAPSDDKGCAFRNFDTRTLADLDAQIIEIGDLVGRGDAAGTLVRKLAEIREATLAGYRPPDYPVRLLFEYCICIKYDPNPDRRFANPGRFVMAGGYLAPELARLAGCEALFAQNGDTVAWTDFREVLDAQPDIVLAFDCGGCANAAKHTIESRNGWRDLNAYRNKAIFRPKENISNPNLCYPTALAELLMFMTDWRHSRNTTVS